VSDKNSIGLAEAIRELRAELIAAQAESPGPDGEGVRFELGPVEMEFAITLSREGSGKAGLQIGVVTLGAGGSLSSESVHRVKFVLTPRDARTGSALEINSQLDSIPER
jgi:hypothetical protein